jgi:hypothetical protein
MRIAWFPFLLFLREWRMANGEWGVFPLALFATH